ncbi:MAG: LamG domain-containing protein [Rikenellaceae bacterium]
MRYLTTLLLTAVTSTAIAANLPTEGLVASYTFDNDTKTTVRDSSGENHGESSKVKYTKGVIGTAAEFNGTSSKILLKDKNGNSHRAITDLKQGTVSFWIKFKNRGGQVLPIIYLGKNDSSISSMSNPSQRGANSLIFEIGHDRGNIDNRRLYFTTILGRQNNFCVDSGMDLDQGRWYHYAAVVSAEGSTIYINGVEITTRRYNLGSTPTSSVFFGDVPVKDQLSIGYGRYSQEESFFSFSGLIDDVNIYNRALSKEEVTALFDQAGLKMGDPELGYIDAKSMEGGEPIVRSGANGRQGRGNRGEGGNSNRSSNFGNRGSNSSYGTSTRGSGSNYSNGNHQRNY